MYYLIYKEKASARWWVILLVAVVLLLFVIPAPAAETATGGEPERSVGVARLESPRPGGRIGDPIPFTLKIHLADGILLDRGSLAGLEIRPERLPPELYSCRIAPCDRQPAGEERDLEIRGTLVIYAPGSYRVSPTRLVCRLRDDDRKTRLVDLPATAQLVKIAALQPRIATSRISLVIPGQPPPLPPRPIESPGRVAAASYFGILSLLLALFCAIGAWLEFSRGRGSTPSSPARSANVSLAERLAQLLASPDRDHDWRLLVEIDHLLRRHLKEELNLSPAVIGGCGVSFARRLRGRLDSEKALALERIYAGIDLVVG
ncbi:MAG: hypothetical protein GXO34_00085, partial [Deltaproteobacteria bacterium]|nr:hypothetical protein [Deltaproteobacteria bacterium]